MYSLAYDTTAAQCGIILSQGDETLDVFSERMDFGQSEVLVPQMQKMLAAKNLSVGDLGLLSVCVGPGSFTGVRAGIAAARAFALACPGLSVAGISAFEAYAASLEADELSPVNAVIIETKRQDFYFQLFDQNRQKMTAPSAGHYDDILPLLRHRKVSLIGDGVERFLSRQSGLSLHAIRLEENLSLPALARAGIRHYKNKTLDFPKPLYLRAPDVTAPK